LALTDRQRDKVAELVRNGRGRNEIAREVGISGRTVSIIAQKAGLTFDRTQTIQATEARSADARARRTVLGLSMLGDLEDGRLRLAQSTSARDFQLTAQGLDALTRAYVNLLKLEPDDNGMEVARGMVNGILAAINASVDGVTRMNATAAFTN
jgi:hypothetical protein